MHTKHELNKTGMAILIISDRVEFREKKIAKQKECYTKIFLNSPSEK